MNMVSSVPAEKDAQLLDGEFQLAELEQRLEMATVSPDSFYYCCMCFNNVAC